MPAVTAEELGNQERRRLYDRWKSMVRRCHNPRAVNYADYGGRSITVCEEWRFSFPAYLAWAFASGYATGLSVERIDNDGGYSPENCRWADGVEQGANKRNNVLVTAYGESKVAAEWLRDPRIKITERGYLCRRARGWDAASALITPPHGAPRGKIPIPGIL